MERDIVAEYQDDYPWLTEVWDYMNSPDFAVETQNSDRAAWVDIYWLNGYELDLTEVGRMVVYSGWVGKSHLDIYVHEMAHVYTLTNRLADQPAPLAAAHLYFSQLANESTASQCWPEELYADAAAVMLFPNAPDHYWTTACSGHSRPTTEAIEVVRQAFEGQMPDWFYDTYENDDGSLDLEAVWSEVQAMEDSWFRHTVAYQLRNAFGGYCDAYQAGRSVTSQDTTLRNPWRDGGWRTPSTPECGSNTWRQPADGFMANPSLRRRPRPDSIHSGMEIGRRGLQLFPTLGS